MYVHVRVLILTDKSVSVVTKFITRSCINVVLNHSCTEAWLSRREPNLYVFENVMYVDVGWKVPRADGIW